MVTTTITSSGLPSTGRMTTRSIARPMRNETTRVMGAANQKLMPAVTRPHAMKVENIAISPCAKFMMSVER